MDRFNRLFAFELYEIQIQVRLVALYAVFNLADEPFFKKKPLGLAQCTLSIGELVTAAKFSTKLRIQLIWTAMSGYYFELLLLSANSVSCEIKCRDASGVFLATGRHRHKRGSHLPRDPTPCLLQSLPCFLGKPPTSLKQPCRKKCHPQHPKPE